MSTTDEQRPCAECGMVCEPVEFHPYAACLMFRGCHDGDKVRANLSSIAQQAPTPAVSDEQIVSTAVQYTIFCEPDEEDVVAFARELLATPTAATREPTQADVEEARRLILDATATDLLSGNRKVVPEDRGTVYRWLCSAANLLLGEAQQAAPLDARDALTELRNIAEAKRFERDRFDNDTAFADWAQSRARYTLARQAAAPAGEKS